MKWPFIILIRLYQLLLSPFMPHVCRFHPTCSAYFLEALQKHGFFRGFWLGVKRLCRCHPFGGYGEDPVP